MKTYASAYMQGSDISRWKEWSTQGAGNKGVPCREFKKSNKPTKSQPAFYYHFALAILNNSSSSLLRLTAPIKATSLGPPLAPVFSIIWSVIQGLSFNLHFTDRKRDSGDWGKWEHGDYPSSQVPRCACLTYKLLPLGGNAHKAAETPSWAQWRESTAGFECHLPLVSLLPFPTVNQQPTAYSSENTF